MLPPEEPVYQPQAYSEYEDAPQVGCAPNGLFQLFPARAGAAPVPQWVQKFVQARAGRAQRRRAHAPVQRAGLASGCCGRAGARCRRPPWVDAPRRECSLGAHGALSGARLPADCVVAPCCGRPGVVAAWFCGLS